jgi:hypothetical protein
VQAPQDLIDENNNTAPPAQATEKEAIFVELPPTPTETRDSPYGSIVGLKKGNSMWLLFRGLFPESTRNGRESAG